MTPLPLSARHLASHPFMRRLATVGATALLTTLPLASTVVASTVFASTALASTVKALPDAVKRHAAASEVGLPEAAVGTAVARRHLKLVKSSPAADTVLAKAPTVIRLWLSEPAELLATRIALKTAAGVAVKTSAVTRAVTKAAPLEAKIATSLANGAYSVTWKAMSKDGHVVNGTFAFTVGAK